jgi:hypothetical protein
VPPEGCLEVAETLLDAKLICPLGGKYECRQTPDGHGYWTSTALDDAAEGGLFTTQAPEGFVSPPLSWFRGLQVEARVDLEALSVHAEVLIQMPDANRQKAGEHAGERLSNDTKVRSDAIQAER